MSVILRLSGDIPRQTDTDTQRHTQADRTDLPVVFLSDLMNVSSDWSAHISHRHIMTLATVLTNITVQVSWLVVTKVRSKSFRLVIERRHYNARPIYALLSYVAQVLFWIVNCGITHFLCTMRLFDVRTSSSSLNPLKCSGIRWLHLTLFSAIQV